MWKAFNVSGWVVGSDLILSLIKKEDWQLKGHFKGPTRKAGHSMAGPGNRTKGSHGRNTTFFSCTGSAATHSAGHEWDIYPPRYPKL